MNQNTQELADRIRAFNDEVIAFVEQCTGEQWQKVCAWEEWSVGVTARHIGAGHFEAIGLAEMIITGQKLPELTMEDFRQMGNQHAREHANCTREEVLAILRKNGAAAADFVVGKTDAELDRQAFLSVTGGDVSARQLLEYVILDSGGEHLANMKSAVEV